jgi:hypothetical protein
MCVILGRVENIRLVALHNRARFSLFGCLNRHPPGVPGISAYDIFDVTYYMDSAAIIVYWVYLPNLAMYYRL